eukprot:11220261-Heterocapsa_arctica.AAC.1
MKVAKDRLPRWAEASVEVTEHIMKEVDLQSICALSLSNILRSEAPRSGDHVFAEPEEAREIVGLLCKGDRSTVYIMEKAGGRGIVV